MHTEYSVLIFYSISTLHALNNQLSPLRARHQRLRIAHFQQLPSAQIQPLQLDLFPAQSLKRGFNRAWQDPVWLNRIMIKHAAMVCRAPVMVCCCRILSGKSYFFFPFPNIIVFGRFSGSGKPEEGFIETSWRMQTRKHRRRRPAALWQNRRQPSMKRHCCANWTCDCCRH